MENKILKEAMKSFVEKGYYRTRIIDIADAVGLSKPYVYRYYRSKDEIFTAACNHVVDEVLQPLIQLFSGPGDLRTVGQQALTHLVDLFVEDMNYYRLLFETDVINGSEVDVRAEDIVYECRKLLAAKFEQEGSFALPEESYFAGSTFFTVIRLSAAYVAAAPEGTREALLGLSRQMVDQRLGILEAAALAD